MGGTIERIEQRLARGLAADMAGYSRLMSTDEVGTALKQSGGKSSIRPLPATGDESLRRPVTDVGGVRECAQFRHLSGVGTE
jgi:hypothetical protein